MKITHPQIKISTLNLIVLMVNYPSTFQFNDINYWLYILKFIDIYLIKLNRKYFLYINLIKKLLSLFNKKIYLNKII